MSERKTINLNPELFNFSSNKTRKKRENKTDGEIKVKTPKPKQRDNTLKKKSILNMIRQHQEEKYKKLFNEKNKLNNEVKNEIDSISQIDSDFEQSKNYLLKLAEENEIKQQNLNKTLKQYPSTLNNSLLFHPNIEPCENVKLDFPDDRIDSGTPISIKPKLSSNQMNYIQPNYGCLKNGSLPTYRQYMNNNNTQKNISNSISNGIATTGSGGVYQVLNNSQIQNLPEIVVKSSQQQGGASGYNAIEHSNKENNIINHKIDENIQKMSGMKQMISKLEAIKNNNYKKAMKQKRIIRRSYKIGKSKVLPKISVLVSNRTIRNNITTKSQLLKQDSINDIKKHLVKRGLIKIGSTAPNDVLRKMYECSSLICGEVQNHNPDNLLHNFLHGKDEV
jgi:hypothetical protein